jgi:DNA-binding response OmpR family regulator
MAPRMLLVDDETPILGALVEYFTTLGWTVCAAQEFEEAAALLETTSFDLVVADVRLGGIHSHEGLELLAEVRAKGLPTRVVLMTAFLTPQVEAEAARLGADALLSKPIPLGTLAAVAARGGALVG